VQFATCPRHHCATWHSDHAATRQPRVMTTWLTFQPVGLTPRGTLATWIMVHVATISCMDCDPRGRLWIVASATWQNAIFFFQKKKILKTTIYIYIYIYLHLFTQKYHKNIRTTFEIYHKHKIKLCTSIIINPTQQ
jgi:hypothetical protein